MPFPNPEAVVSIKMKHRLRGRLAIGSFETYWECASPSLMGDPVAMLALLNLVNAGISVSWAGLASEYAEWRRTEAYFYCGSTQNDMISTGAMVNGTFETEVAEMLPDDVSLIIQKRTGLAGRRNRGRVYIPFLAEGISNGGVIDTAVEAACDALAAKIGSNYTSGGFTIAARHWRRDVKNEAGAIITPGDLKPVTDTRWIDVLGTQRQRAPYRLGTAH